ncbi:MAG TPA: phosphodiester glycosidase family protein [Armatimonadota bacterium]|jgi:uncharacterized protein YigE (DUF2233 family)
MLRTRIYGWLISGVLLLGIIAGVLLWWRNQWAAPRWREAEAGLEICRLSGTQNWQPVRVTVVRVDPARWTFRVVDAHGGVPQQGAGAAAVCPAHGAAINASYFAEDLTPLGLLVIDGRQTQRHFPVHVWGTFQIRRGRPELVLSTDEVAAGVTQALECKPRLLVHGQAQHFVTQPPARRSAVGIDAQGRVLLAVTADGRLTLEQWAACLRAPLGCMDALNLDGGPSTQLALRGRLDDTVSGGWPVPVFLTCSPVRPR